MDCSTSGYIQYHNIIHTIEKSVVKCCLYILKLFKELLEILRVFCFDILPLPKINI